MKICIIVARFPYGGAEKQALAFAKALEASGKKAEILALENKETFVYKGIKVVGGNLKVTGLSIKRIIAFFKFHFRLLQILKTGYDYVITYPQNYFLALYPLKNVQKVLSIRIFYLNSTNYFRRLLLKKFHIVITNNLPQHSLLVANNIESLLINNKVEVFDEEVIKVKPNKKFLVVSNVKRRKNLDVVIKAFNLLYEAGFELYIAGRIEDQEYQSELKKLINYQEKITFLGNLDRTKLTELYKEVEGVIVPSLREGAANVIFESMNLGKPLLVSDIPENISLIENIDTYKFEHFNADSLAEKVKALHTLIESEDRDLLKYLEFQKTKIELAYSGNDYSTVIDRIFKTKLRPIDK